MVVRAGHGHAANGAVLNDSGDGLRLFDGKRSAPVCEIKAGASALDTVAHEAGPVETSSVGGTPAMHTRSSVHHHHLRRLVLLLLCVASVCVVVVTRTCLCCKCMCCYVCSRVCVCCLQNTDDEARCRMGLA